MRIISGERRGHKFDGPEDSVTRPTSDMVREAIFNILGDRAEDRVVYDLFAGSGALGLEALSRGATFGIFVEKERRNMMLIKRNLATLKFEGRGSILGADVYRWVQTFMPEDSEPVLVLIDPPYRDFSEKTAKVRELIAILMERLPKGSTIVVESERDPEIDLLPDADRWDVRRYGRTQTAFLDLDDEVIEDVAEVEEMNRTTREFAVSVVKTLREAGHKALFAGGCVRDLLLGITPADYDVASDATPEQVMRLFRRTVPVGVSFGVVRVRGSKNDGEVEVATFRSDGEYRDGRHPESVTFGTAEADALRRDFTINGMFLDPINDQVIDYVGGRQDLDRRVIRAIGDPFARFAEDKLRLLRAIRFTARFGFKIERETGLAIAKMAGEVNQVSIERIVEELRKMMIAPTRVAAMKALRSAGLLDVLLPGFIGAEDVWSETLRVLEFLPDEPSFPLAMAAFLRGLGGVQEIVDGWKLSNSDRDRILSLVQRQAALVDAGSLPRSRLKRLLALPERDELIELHSAIARATDGDWNAVAYCRRYLQDLPDGPIDPPPLVTGRDLIEAGLEPGPRFATLLERIRDAQLDGQIRSKDEALAMIS